MTFEVPNSTSPFWQKPGRYWELIPEVPYLSYREYRDLSSSVALEYCRLIKQTMEEEFEDGKLNRFDLLLEMAYIGLSWNFKHVLADKGPAVLLRLTKGHGSEWCDLINSFLICILDSTTRTYTSTKNLFPVESFEAAIAETCSYLQRQACFFIKERNLNPMGYYSFFYANFKYYKSSEEPDYHETQNMPIQQFKDIMAAFVMGSHERLGAGSCVGMLHDELLRFIFKFEIFD